MVASIVVPLVMYPLLLWAMLAGLSFVAGQAERLTSRVAIQGLPEAHGALADSLAAHDRIRLTDWAGDRESAHRAIAEGRLDVHVVFEPASVGAGGVVDNFRVTIWFSEARDRSYGARNRVESAMAWYREALIDDVRRELGVADPVWADFVVVRSDVATPVEISRSILALVVPLLTLIMVALASFYPAIDATAGERERSTWETLLTVSASRGQVATAKYLYVATFGALGGLLNLTALALSLGWISSMVGAPEAEELAGTGIPLAALPVIGLGIALLALFVAAGMLAFAVFARNFKEGQSMIMPFYVAVFLPALFLRSPDIEFTLALALVPVVNVAMLIREVIVGSVPVLQGGVTLLAMALSVAGAVYFAQWTISREEVLLGSGQGGLLRFLRGRYSMLRRQR